MYKQSFKRTRASLSIGKNGCVVTVHDVLDGTLPNDAARKKVEDKDTNKNERALVAQCCDPSRGTLLFR